MGGGYACRRCDDGDLGKGWNGRGEMKGCLPMPCWVRFWPMGGMGHGDSQGGVGWRQARLMRGLTIFLDTADSNDKSSASGLEWEVASRGHS